MTVVSVRPSLSTTVRRSSTVYKEKPHRAPKVTKGGSAGFYTQIPFQGTRWPVPCPLSQLTPSGLVILVTETLLK